MRVAIIGSRNLEVEIAGFIPENTSVLISGGAVGIDACVREYAVLHGIAYEEYRPNYKLFGKLAPFVRNTEIVRAADLVIAIWDGTSRGTRYTIEKCKELNKPLKIFCKKTEL